MKAIFNDATELTIQAAAIVGNLLQIKTVSATREELRTKFSDEFACRKIQIEERGQIIATYERYTELYRIEEYTGAILGVAMYRAGETPEERLDGMDSRVTNVEQALQIIVTGEGGTEDDNEGTGETVPAAAGNADYDID